MSLQDLLGAEERRRFARNAALLGVSGLMITLIPTLIASVIDRESRPGAAVVDRAGGGWITALTALAVLAAMGAFYLSYRRGSPGMVGVLERSLAGLRVRVTERVAAAGLRDVERVGAVEPVYTREVETIGAFFAWGAPLVQLVAVTVPALLYIGYLSPLTLLILLVLALPLWPLLEQEFTRSREASQELSQESGELQRLLTQAIDGFAQLRADSRASDSLFDEIEQRCDALERQGKRHDAASRNTMIAGWNLVIGSIGLVLFLLPRIGSVDVQMAYKLALLLNLLDAPVLIFAAQFHLFIGARVAYQNILGFEARLPPEPTAAPGAAPAAFSTIELRGVTFHYPAADGPGFGVGPVDLRVGPGEILFITGENGSGKTTVMKLLCGLYAPQHGALALDGRPLSAAELPRYRALFTTVFADHALLTRLYDETVDPAKVDALLDRFHLRGSTRFVDGRFTSIDLSSGQARRLAMVVALLEDRPILLLDEWTAHQDPERRRFFYEELLPELRARGKAIIAVSHDDHYFHCADRRVHIAAGRVQEIPCQEPLC